MNLRNYKTVKERRAALEKARGIALSHIGSFTLDERVASSRNCENMVGAAQIPLGVAGPLRIYKKEYFIPLATTEGALVASVNRGCKAIRESGGAMVDSYLVGTTRGAVFEVHNLKENDALNTFLQTHMDQLQAVAKKTSGHIALMHIFSRGVGRRRYVRFVFDTKDAMGMNMATIATTSLCTYITNNTSAPCITVAGNYDVDKKPSWLNLIEGRGRKVWAEAVIPSDVLAKTLKTNAKKVFDVWLAKCMVGSAMAGSMGFNAHMANVVAALFLATGQDPAHVVEASCGITTCDVLKKDLYISILMPDLMIGTVGGGTGLATQKEALSIIGATTTDEFAQVVGAAVLAGEISLLASLSEGTLSQAHERLARGRA